MPITTADVDSRLAGLNKAKAYPLTKYQQRQIDESKPVYIYNVSPIHEWQKAQGQLGTITIQKRKSGERVSVPTIIKGAVARWYDKGLGRKEVFIEDGREIAEDICGCSKEYPAESSNNNLVNFGVFILDQPFEELTAGEQEEILGLANGALDAKLRQMILEADQLKSEGHENWISPIQRAALNCLNELTGGNETRPWAPIRTTARSADCPYCGAKNKPGVPKCANCHEVIDPAAYAALKKQAKA